jgi:hypothetical protein
VASHRVARAVAPVAGREGARSVATPRAESEERQVTVVEDEIRMPVKRERLASVRRVAREVRPRRAGRVVRSPREWAEPR